MLSLWDKVTGISIDDHGRNGDNFVRGTKKAA